MALYCQHAAHTGVPIYLYGGRSEDALVELTLALRTRFPALRSSADMRRRFAS